MYVLILSTIYQVYPHYDMLTMLQYREMVGKMLAARSDLGSPGPYIPTVYQLTEKMDVHSCELSKV